MPTSCKPPFSAHALATLCLFFCLPLPLTAQTFAQRYDALIENADGLSDTARLHRLFELQREYELAEFPESATYAGVDGFNDRWTDLSLDAIERRRADATRPVRVLRSIDRDELSAADRLNYDLFAQAAGITLDATRFRSELMPINQLNSEHLALAQMMSIAPARNASDFEDILARLDAVPLAVEQWIELLGEGVESGIVQPAIVLRDVPGQVLDLAVSDVERNPFYAPFLEMPDTIGPGAAARLRERGADAIRNRVVPAYIELHEYLTDIYLPNARDRIALSALPDGEAWYLHAVRQYTTTDLSPAEIHQLGLSEVERIRAEMEAVIDASGFDGTFDEFLAFLRTDARFYHESADALLAGYRDIAKRIDPALTRLFGRLPRMPYGVEPIPDYNAPSETTARYRPGSVDANRPGTFLANTYDLRSRPIWEMEALTLHEAVPGHHLQIALQDELEHVPEFRRNAFGNTVFIEGWGLYAESLGEELGLYRDPYSKFGQLTYEMWRAIRLVVDTGIHSMGWTRDEAIDYFLANSSKPLHDVTVEIDRYIAWPGQALAYKIGELKFKELRTQARDALGESFDVRAFHDALLAEGALPLDVLDARMRNWIEAQR